MLICGLLMTLWLADDPVVQFGVPIPAADWAVQEDATQEIFDAVLLEDVTIFKLNAIWFYRKVRILSESGKAAAEYYAPSGKVRSLKGRVVDRSGREVTFDKKEDFVQVLVYKTRGDREKTRVLVPPGLTKDAVVEYSWRVDAIEGLRPNRYQDIYLVQSPYFAKEKRFEIRPKALGSSNGYTVTRFLSTRLAEPAGYEREAKGGKHTITYRNVPPSLYYPYGNRLLDKNTAYVMLYTSLAGYPDDTERFWKRFSKMWLKDYYSEKLNSSKEYKTWLASVREGMPEAKHEALLHVYDRFREKVKTPDLLTPTRLAQIEEDKDAERNVLRRAMTEGFAGYHDVGKVFLRVLQDLDIECKLLFANSLEGMLFFPNHLRPFDLRLTKPFFGIQTGERTWTIVSPLYQEYSPGYIPAEFQGTTALAVDPFNGWTHSFPRIPRFGPNEHQRITQYESALGENGTLTCKIQQEVSGEYNAREKLRYMASSAQDRLDKARNRWENRLSNMTVSKVDLEKADTLQGNVVTRIEATGQLEADDADWIILSPFPGQTQPLGSPNFWPEKRTQPIILNHCFNQVDLNVIQVPEGWTVMGQPSWQKANPIGEVRFAVLQKGNQITVRRDIKVKGDLLGAPQEKELKNLIAWMMEAMNQRLGLAKGGSGE